MPEPGYYKTDHKALTIREMVRMKGVLKLPMIFIATRFVMPPGAGVWMPGKCAEVACNQDELSPRFWAVTEFQRNAIEKLGFVLCQFSKVKRNLNPLSLDNGGIIYLHRDGKSVATLVFVRMKTVESIAIGFTAAFEKGGVSFVNYKQRYDDLPGRESVLIRSNDPAVIYERFTSHLKTERRQLRVFASCDEARVRLDEATLEAFEARVERGLFVRMSDEEVADAQRLLKIQQNRQ